MADINKTVVPADAFSTVDHDEYAAAEAQAKESVGNYTLKLKRPFTYEGQTFDELNFDFEGLTGDDALAIEDELQAIGKPTISPTFSGQFLVRMAARACTNTIIDASGHPRRIGDDALRALPEGRGGGVVIRQHPGCVRAVYAQSAEELEDADTVERLEALKRFL